MERTEIVWQYVHWPQPLASDQALGLLRRLASDSARSTVIFEARVVEGRVFHLVGTPAHQVREVSQTIEAHVQDVVLSKLDQPRISFTRTVRMRLRRPSLILRTEQLEQSARGLLAALAAARFRDESAAVQLTLGRGLPSRLSSTDAADPTQSWFDIIAHGSRRPSPEVAASVREKNSQVGFHAALRVAASAKSDGRRVEIIRGLVAAARTLQMPGTRIEFLSERGRPLDTLPNRGWLRLSSSEVLALTAWPLDSESLPGLPELHPKLLRLRGNDLERERIFAMTNAPGEAKPVGIGSTDSLLHTLTIGPTGSGKSTTLLSLISHDLQAGRAVVVIDAKAELIHSVLERVPAHRYDDVIVLDPSQPRPPGINPLSVHGTSPEVIADGILGIFRDLFPSAFGPRVSDVAHASILTLANSDGATLTWLVRLLTDARFRRRLIEKLEDQDGLREFWAGFSEFSERQQAQFVAPVLSRLRQLILRPSLRRVLDQSQPKFNLQDVFTKNRILLVPLNSGLLGADAARLLGSLLVRQLWQLTLARAATAPQDRPIVSIYIDEAQEFLRLGGELTDALARSRSLGVAWHIAHQYRDQMSPEARAALDANALNKIVFRLGVKDAREFAAMAPELVSEDFMALPRFGVYANVMRHGQSLGWVSAQTLPPPPITSDPVELIARSQARYGADPASTNTGASTAQQAAATDRSPQRPSSDSAIGRKRRTT